MACRRKQAQASTCSDDCSLSGLSEAVKHAQACTCMEGCTFWRLRGSCIRTSAETAAMGPPHCVHERERRHQDQHLHMHIHTTIDVNVTRWLQLRLCNGMSRTAGTRINSCTCSWTTKRGVTALIPNALTCNFDRSAVSVEYSQKLHSTKPRSFPPQDSADGDALQHIDLLQLADLTGIYYPPPPSPRLQWGNKRISHFTSIKETISCSLHPQKPQRLKWRPWLVEKGVAGQLNQ